MSLLLKGFATVLHVASTGPDQSLIGLQSTDGPLVILIVQPAPVGSSFPVGSELHFSALVCPSSSARELHARAIEITSRSRHWRQRDVIDTVDVAPA